MNLERIQSEALKLDPRSRARLASMLLQSLESLSEEENTRIWAEEAERRNREMDAEPGSGRSADEVLRDAESRLE